MVNNLTLLIKDIEAELLALKTAYARSLGVANFYEASETDQITIDHSGQYVYVTVTFAPEEDGGIPFSQCYLANASIYTPVNIVWSSANNSLIYTFAAYVSPSTISITARIVASATVSTIEFGVGA